MSGMKSKKYLLTALLPLILLFCWVPGCTGPIEPADLVLIGGKVVTVDEAMPEAEAIAISGYTITAVGSNRKINRYIGESTSVIELEGRLVIPGFIEGHGHFTSLGESMLKLDLTEVENWDQIVQMVAEAASQAERGEWILGRGWHQEKWNSVPEPSVESRPVDPRQRSRLHCQCPGT